MSSTPDSIVAAKQSLRKQFSEFRAALSTPEYERRSRLIADEVTTLPELLHARVVHVYWPMIDRHEVDTRPVVHRLDERGVTVVLPKVVQFDRYSSGSARLRHVRYPGASELVVNRWGISEPNVDEDVDVSSLDAVIVPVLGAGRNGHRIGHGFGFYDEFLSVTRAVTIGLVYKECLVDYVPHERHDIPIDILISEAEVFRVT